MPERNKKYIVSWSGEFYVKVDETFYKRYPDNILTQKKDVSIRKETDDLEHALYDACCRHCVDQKRCHDDCEKYCLDDDDATMNKIQQFVEEGEI